MKGDGGSHTTREVEMGVVPRYPRHRDHHHVDHNHRGHHDHHHIDHTTTVTVTTTTCTRVRGCVGGQLGWCLGPRCFSKLGQIVLVMSTIMFPTPWPTTPQGVQAVLLLPDSCSRVFQHQVWPVTGNSGGDISYLRLPFY